MSWPGDRTVRPCTLGQQPAVDAMRVLAGTDHTARFELPIPYFTGLIGLEFYQQALVLDPGANPAGIVTSDAAHAVVGG